MDFSLYMIPVYAIAAASALVVAVPKWRVTGTIVFLASIINIVFMDDLENFYSPYNGAFFFVYDAIVAHILFWTSKGRSAPLIMALIMFFFCVAHAAYGVSFYVGNYSFFWKEYANIILTLNLIQLSFLIRGVYSGARVYLRDHGSFGLHLYFPIFTPRNFTYNTVRKHRADIKGSQR